MKKQLSILGILLMLVVILFCVTGCGNKKKQEENIQADAILYVEAMGGEIIEKYTYYFDFTNKKLFMQDNSIIVPLQTKEEAKKNTNNTKESFKEYNLTQEQIDKAKEFIKQAKDKNEAQNQQLAVKAKVKVDGKEYVVNDYHSTWRDLLNSITK